MRSALPEEFWVIINLIPFSHLALIVGIHCQVSTDTYPLVNSESDVLAVDSRRASSMEVQQASSGEWSCPS